MSDSFFWRANLNAQDRDPFVSTIELKRQKSAAHKKINLSEIILQGIIYNQKRSVAIINNELVMAGDDWQGFKVVRIGKDSVTLNDGINSYDIPTAEASMLDKTIPITMVQEPPPEGMGGQQELMEPYAPEGAEPYRTFRPEQDNHYIEEQR